MTHVAGTTAESIPDNIVQAKESLILSECIASHKSVLIAGDFNMLEKSPIYKKYWSIFTNAFSKTGFGFGYTRYSPWHRVRIDHVLCDGDWRVIRSYVGPDIGSDHRPVIVDVEFIGRNPVGPKAEEEREEISSNKAALISEGFEISLGKLEDYGTANISIDTEIGYLHGNALKVECYVGMDYAAIGISLDSWHLEDYPIISFAYMIPEGVPVGMRVKTVYDDWIYLGGTATVRYPNSKVKNGARLVDDGEWHEIDIDAQSAVKSILPRLKSLKEFQFYIQKNKYQRETFWMDDFRINQQ